MKPALPPLLALFVGAITFAFTVGLCLHERENEQARLRTVFDSSAQQTAGRIEQRVANFEQMLRGAQGLVAHAGHVDRPAFEAYVDAVMAGPDAAGLRGMAWGPLVTRAALPALVDSLRRDGQPDFEVTPAGDREQYVPLALIAPDDASNRGAPGFDVLSDPARRAALLQSRDSGNVAITGRLRLRVDTAGTLQPGCLMYLPIYAAGSDTGSVAARRANGIGWVWLAFRVGDLMSTLYGDQGPGLVVRLYDGTEPIEASLMYTSLTSPDDARGPPRFEARAPIALAGHRWTLLLTSLPEFERAHDRGASAVILLAGGVLSLLLGVITHQLVTGRARAYAVAQAMTRELRASEERYRRIVDTAGEGIWLLDASQRVEFVNPRILQWLGVTETAMLGRPVEEFMDPRDAARCCAAFEATPADDASAPIEFRLRRRDGGSKWVSLSLRTIVDEAGAAAGSLGMLADIDERRLAEERRGTLERQLRDSQKMEAIGTLAGGIAHDFNNILAAILGNVAMARQDAAAGVAHDASLGQIERAAVRARSLVQQILTFSRMQAQELHTQALQPVIEETLEMLRAAMPAQVELVVDLPPSPVHVRVDATQIQQVVMNLCTNAWHALPGGRGRIEVGLRVESGPPDWAHLWIVDDGSGMAEATRQRIFEPFFTTKQVGQGTGLGLAVVHGIVSVHGGSIHVDSTPGLGSRFDLRFPLQERPAPAAAPAPSLEAAPRGAGQHVLCVDDDPAMVLMMEGLLRRSGYAVTVFEQAAAALAAVEADPGAFDIVVSDFNMPGMSGMALAQALAVVAPGLPVIITSGFISDEMRQQATAFHVGALLQKEYTLERLAGLVDGVLAGRAVKA